MRSPPIPIRCKENHMKPITGILLAVLCCFLAGCEKGSEVTVLSKNAIRVSTTAASHVTPAMHYVYEEMRLRRFMDERGKVTFPDGTSTEKKKIERSSRTGAFLHSYLSFETPEGGFVTMNYYAEDGRDGLLVWECRDVDPQKVSEHLQISLAKSLRQERLDNSFLNMRTE